MFSSFLTVKLNFDDQLTMCETMIKQFPEKLWEEQKNYLAYCEYKNKEKGKH